jgi:16S rRNA (cytidine1402-2'-O)-methyltransferase
MSTLYLVATPIGNLEDITLRALNVLKSVSVVFCEDQRVTKRLLEIYQIKTPTRIYHQHSNDKQINELLEFLKNKNDVAVVTDAGTPGISDPGNLLVNLVRCELPEVEVVPIPGASAVITLLSASGLPTDHFEFLGFIPHKKGRQTFWKYIAECEHTTVFYESCHRIAKALQEAEINLEPERELVVGRELTKKFESIIVGGRDEVIKKVLAEPLKGEYVVAIAPRKNAKLNAK